MTPNPDWLLALERIWMRNPVRHKYQCSQRVLKAWRDNPEHEKYMAWAMQNYLR